MVNLEAYHLKYPSEHGLACVGPDTKSSQFSNSKTYVAVQRTPDQAQGAAANGRVMERMVEQDSVWLYSRLYTSAALLCCIDKYTDDTLR